MKIATRLNAQRISPSFRPLLSASLLLPLFSASSLFAATQLGEVNVTANRTAQSVDETLAAVTVITRDDIEKSQAKDLVQLLSGQPGIVTRSTGGLGKTATLIVRGTASSHLLVLIDGVRVGSATLGQASFQDITLAPIERLEIVRGPRSQLYGSDAIGGVLQVFTRKGGKSTRVDADMGYGSHNTLKGTVGVSGRVESTTYALRLSQLKTDGFNALKDNNPDKDGYENSSVAVRLGHQFNNDAEVSLNVLRSEGNNEYDSAWGLSNLYDSDFVQQSISGKFEYAINEWWDTQVTAGHSLDKTTNFTNGVEDSNFDTKRKQVSWQNDFLVGDENILTLGADFMREEVEGSSDYSVNERDTTGLFFQYQAQLADYDLALGVRHDDSDSYGNRNTYNVAVGRHLTNEVRVMASYGTAFKAPTFNDLYYQDPWGSNGNPNLEPEESSSFELGLIGQQGWGDWSVRAFRTDIDSLIQWVDLGSYIYQPQNVAKARIDGLEVGASTQVMGWSLSANVTLMDPVDTGSGLLLIKRSKQSLLVDVSKRFGSSEVGARLQANSETFSDTANTKRAAGYGTVDLFASHNLDRNWTIRGQISNLLDHDYEETPGYHTAGRELFVSVVYESE